MDSPPKILQQSNTKRIYTIATHVNHISRDITTKNKETCNNTNHHNTHPHLEDKKPITIR